jgi:hypothetical protein
MSTPIHFYTRIAAPSPRNPNGSVEEGWYVIEKGFVQLTDAAGAPLLGENHRIKLRPEDDALVLAQRMLRSRVASKARWHRGPIDYPPLPEWM